MNEKGKNRKEWIKNVAIIFLVIMLILTFFSNTIMNYSLPQVAAQYVQSGTITAKIRGTGTVTSSDPYSVKITETRKISSVPVKVGDTVAEGDVLVLLEDKESKELTEAQAAYDKAMLDFELALLSGEISNSTYNNVQSGNVSSMSTYQARIVAAEAEIDAAQAEIDKLQKAVDEASTELTKLSAQQTLNSNTTVDTSAEQAKVTEKQAAVNNDEYKILLDKISAWQTELDACNETIAKYQQGIVTPTGSTSGSSQEGSATTEPGTASTEPGNATTEPGTDTNPYPDGTTNVVSEAEYNAAVANAATYTKLIEEARAGLTEEKKAAYEQKVKELTEAQTTLSNKQNSTTNSANSLASQVTNWTVEKDAREAKVTAAKTRLEAAQEAKTQLIKDISSELNLDYQLDDLKKQRDEIAKLQENAVGASVTAPIAGTITAINVKAGDEAQAQTEIITMQPEGRGYTMSFSVTNEQAKRLSVGDVADLVNSWRYDDLTVTLASIKPDTAEPGQKKLLTFDVTGADATVGDNISVSVGQKSANYDLIVPNSAIREDSNGKFILTVESKSSPLGNRYIATRVDVEVVASDDTQSAVNGALYGYEFVITTSTAPVEAGKQVRLADN